MACWTSFAKATGSLPASVENDRWRRAAAPIIGLHALTFALSELDQLPADEAAVGLDRASILIERHRAELAAVWDAVSMPEEVALLVRDAILAHRRAAEHRTAQ